VNHEEAEQYLKDRCQTDPCKGSLWAETSDIEETLDVATISGSAYLSAYFMVMWEPSTGYTIQQTAWEMYAHRYDDGRFCHVGSEQYVRANGLKKPMFRVLVEEVDDDDETATHWGWMGFAWSYHEADTEPNMIWHTKGQFKMCFTYGPQAEVDRGRGRILRLRITEIPAAV
jgi:hypothetical protein